MIVYNSMILVVVLLMLIYRIQQPNPRIRLTQPIPWSYAIIAMGYIVFWAGLRSGFVDSNAYIRQFKEAPQGLDEAWNVLLSDTKDSGFTFLQILFKTLVSSDFHYWLMFIALATGLPIMVVYRNKSVDFLFSMYLFICSVTFIWMFNGIRQFLAAAILFGFGFLIEKKKFVPFLIVLFLCSSIHGTAWLLLPMYFFVTDRPFGKRMIIFIVAVLSCSIAVNSLLETMDIMLQETQYSSNLAEFAEDDGVHPLRVLFSCVPVILAFIQRKKIVATNNQYIYMCVNMSTIAAGLYFVGMLTSGIMIGRLPVFFILYNYILYPYLFNYIYSGKKTLLYTIISITYLVFYYLMAQNFYYVSDILGNYA